MRLSVAAALVALAACGGDAFAPTDEDLLGDWRLLAQGDPPEDRGALRCTQELSLEITSESATLGSGTPDSLVGLLTWAGTDGWRRCINDDGGIVIDEPYLQYALLLVALDEAGVEIWRGNGQFLYRGQVTSPTEMRGELGPGNTAGPGRWWAERQ